MFWLPDGAKRYIWAASHVFIGCPGIVWLASIYPSQGAWCSLKTTQGRLVVLAHLVNKVHNNEVPVGPVFVIAYHNPPRLEGVNPVMHDNSQCNVISAAPGTTTQRTKSAGGCDPAHKPCNVWDGREQSFTHPWGSLDRY